MNKTRLDELDPLRYTDEMPTLMSAWGRVDIHTIVAKFLADNKVNGVYLEFGVGKGRSAVSAIRAYSRENICHKFHLFDSFRGLPRLEGPDQNSEQFKEGDYAFSKQNVAHFLENHGISTADKVEFIEGWIEDSFENWVTKNSGIYAAIVHVDVDLYSSCANILKQLKPLLKNGTVILFDDWNCFKANSNQGERRAVKEWLKINPDLQLHSYCPYGWHGQSFVVEIDGEIV